MSEETIDTKDLLVYANAVVKEKKKLEAAVKAAVIDFETITGAFVRDLNINRTWHGETKTWRFVSVAPRIEL